MADWGAVTGAVAFHGEAFLRLSPAKASSPTPTPTPRPSWDNNKRDDENIMKAIVSKEIKVHDMRLPMAELRIAMNNIQRSLKMIVQMQGKWSPEATACLIKMLGKPKRRSTASGRGAIADAEPENNIPQQNAIANGGDNEPENHDNTNADNDRRDPENTKDADDDQGREQHTDSDTSETKKKRKKKAVM